MLSGDPNPFGIKDKSYTDQKEEYDELEASPDKEYSIAGRTYKHHKTEHIHQVNDIYRRLEDKIYGTDNQWPKRKYNDEPLDPFLRNSKLYSLFDQNIFNNIFVLSPEKALRKLKRYMSPKTNIPKYITDEKKKILSMPYGKQIFNLIKRAIIALEEYIGNVYTGTLLSKALAEGARDDFDTMLSDIGSAGVDIQKTPEQRDAERKQQAYNRMYKKYEPIKNMLISNDEYQQEQAMMLIDSIMMSSTRMYEKQVISNILAELITKLDKDIKIKTHQLNDQIETNLNLEKHGYAGYEKAGWGHPHWIKKELNKVKVKRKEIYDFKQSL